MITDNQANRVYFSFLLPQECPLPFGLALNCESTTVVLQATQNCMLAIAKLTISQLDIFPFLYFYSIAQSVIA